MSIQDVVELLPGQKASLLYDSNLYQFAFGEETETSIVVGVKDFKNKWLQRPTKLTKGESQYLNAKVLGSYSLLMVTTNPSEPIDELFNQSKELIIQQWNRTLREMGHPEESVSISDNKT